MRLTVNGNIKIWVSIIGSIILSWNLKEEIFSVHQKNNFI